MFIAIVLSLRVNYKRSATWQAALLRVDLLGNAIFIPSMVSLFFGLIMGGNNTAGYPWNSWRVILPLVLGVVGWVCFHLYESSPICREPSTPPRLFKHRTSAIGFLMIFLASIVLQGISYFLPIYFQAVKGASPLLSGVYYLPFTVGLIPLAGLAGGFLSKTGHYKPVHWAGFALSATGVGLFSILNESTPTGTWIGIQLVAAAGAGFIFTVTLPSTLAPLSEADVAVATGTYSFVRSLGLVWGATMSSIIFNNQVDAHLGTLTDPSFRHLLAEGAAYTFASGPGIHSLPDTVRTEVIHIYVQAMRIVWLVFVGVSSIGFLATFLEKPVELRKENNSEFGLLDKNQIATGAPEKGTVADTENSQAESRAIP